MRKYYVYRHRTETDGRVFYIGCGTKQRCFNKKKSNRSKEWFDIYENEGLKVEILHITTDEEEAFLLESDYIEKYKRIDDGGTLVNKATFKSAVKGRIITDEWKTKISNTLKKPILQYTKDYEFIREWSCIIEAEKTLKIHNIGGCCNGKRKSSGGFIWKYK